MYRAIGDESSWRDGVFSHAAPFQDYQASVKQFEEGSLGAYARPARSGMSVATRRRNAPQMRGFGSSFRDGSLGAYAYRSGVLGDTTPTATPTAPSTINLPSIPGTTAAPTTITIGPNGVTSAPTPPPVVPYFQRPAVQIAAAGGLAVILYLCLRKK
jgi:hypothetical protein